ncbi:TIGR02391 family protein [Rathayibacter sp. VKM Ac-2927]|uniref:TIGR02391 family protein n=1 Tax=Rathayibacter sp. VKM Ac-2927 TaxID=2929478 RepID=UPI001FB3C20D|nr:TIGR02391 family protein [Rathayibacter sp. VKM Ac-2927]MCJ1689078.1 TIGR02391 family protein [Rathayibacter sp. VKM Ac-2927]
MTRPNTKFALKELDNLNYSTELVPHPFSNVIGRSVRGSKEDIAAQVQILKQILDRVVARWRVEVPHRVYIAWADYVNAALRARPHIERADEIRQKLGDDTPGISGADLHTGVGGGARLLWQSGHFGQPVRDAATRLNAGTHNKVERRDVSETNLFKQSFSLDEPKPGKPRLRRMSPEFSDIYRPVKRGAMSLAKGVFAGMRDSPSRESDQELSDEVAFGNLASLSVLARWVNESNVEHTGGAS